MSDVADWAVKSEPYASGRKAPIGALSDAALLESLQRYKRQVAKRYRVAEPDQIERQLPESERLFVSPKLDGELWFLVHRAESHDVALVAFNGRVLHGIALLGDLGARLTKAKAPSFVVAGELHVLKSEDAESRGRVHHVASALSEGRAEPSLAFSAFDVLDEAGRDVLARPYEERLSLLRTWLGEGKSALPRLTVVPTEEASPAEIAKRYRKWTEGGTAEGVVVRSDRGLTYKIKPTSTVDVVVVAYGERITGELHQVRELQVALLREDGSFQLVGSVGGGFSEDDRTRWLERLTPLAQKSSFRLANREGTLCRFVRPEVVVELKVSDFITTDGWDVPLRRMSLGYDPTTGWRAITETRTPVLLHPVLIRERTDKKVDVASVGFSQITSHLDAEGIPVMGPASEATEPRTLSSAVVARHVFTKETKGEIAVRKVVVVRTHKEQEGTHPPFVVFTTDFSPNRKAPLETALRTAPTRELADGIVVAWLAENVKRGWSASGAATAAAEPAPAAEEPPAKKPRASKKPKSE